VSNLTLRPLTLKEANQLVAELHRHHKPVVGHRFSIGCFAGERLVGVAIVGRPVARGLQDGRTAEVNRLATDGTKNACSMLYAASWRAWSAMGGGRLITYILDSEPGTSLRAAGWVQTAKTKPEPNGWDRNNRSRARVDHDSEVKQRWEKNSVDRREVVAEHR